MMMFKQATNFNLNDFQTKVLMERFCPIAWIPSHLNFNVVYFRSKRDIVKALGLGILIIGSMLMFSIVVENKLKGSSQIIF